MKELDLSGIGERISRIRKEYEGLIREGAFYRLISPFTSVYGETAWIVSV